MRASLPRLFTIAVLGMFALGCAGKAVMSSPQSGLFVFIAGDGVVVKPRDLAHKIFDAVTTLEPDLATRLRLPRATKAVLPTGSTEVTLALQNIGDYQVPLELTGFFYRSDGSLAESERPTQTLFIPALSTRSFRIQSVSHDAEYYYIELHYPSDS